MVKYLMLTVGFLAVSSSMSLRADKSTLATSGPHQGSGVDVDDPTDDESLLPSAFQLATSGPHQGSGVDVDDPTDDESLRAAISPRLA